MKNLSKEFLSQLDQSCNNDDIRSKGYAIANAGLKKVSLNKESMRQYPFYFNVEIKQGDICNQKQSGRCWLFATCNFLRSHLIKKYNLKTFELSQTYLFFYDKLEKSNYFLESILETTDQQVHSRLLDHLLSSPIGDGGQWDMVVDLIEKYGIVPKYAMEETESSNASRELCSLLTSLLRQDAIILREKVEQGCEQVALSTIKDEMMQQIYQLLVMTLGKPCQRFDFRCKDKDDKNIEILNCTPLSFYHDVIGLDLTQYVSLLNAPTSDKPYNKTYTVAYLGNVAEGKGIKYLNLPIEQLKQATIKQLQAGECVWFGSDVSHDFDREYGYGIKDIFDYNTSAHVQINMTKQQRLDYDDSAMNHAMVIQGVNLDLNGKPLCYKVENSWGDKSGNKGYFLISDDWFDDFVYQVVINKKYLTLQQCECYDQQPIVLQPWDPCGSLAKCK